MYPIGYNIMANVIADFVKEMRRQYGMTPDTYRKQRKNTEGIPSDTSMEP